MMSVTITRIVNSCVLIEGCGYAVLTDPWFHDRWYLRFGEPLGMEVRALPKLTAIVGTHSLPNHWDFRSLADCAYKDQTQLFVATAKMARQARQVGFTNAEVAVWGDERNIAPRLALETIEAHRSFGLAVNSYILSLAGIRIFFGGEARDLEPLRRYRQDRPPVDILMAPVNGVHFLGRKLVMGPHDLIAAAGILGAKIILPIHDALDPAYRFLPGFLLRRTGSATDAVNIGGLITDDPIRIHPLATGEKWCPLD